MNARTIFLKLFGNGWCLVLKFKSKKKPFRSSDDIEGYYMQRASYRLHIIIINSLLYDDHSFHANHMNPLRSDKRKLTLDLKTNKWSQRNSQLSEYNVRKITHDKNIKCCYPLTYCTSTVGSRLGKGTPRQGNNRNCNGRRQTPLTRFRYTSFCFSAHFRSRPESRCEPNECT